MAGKLRHLALSVPDRYAAAEFYEKIFEMDRMAENETPDAKVIYLSDGVMSLALIEYRSDMAAGKETSRDGAGKEFIGIHHMGFWVDDVSKTQSRINTNGGTYMMGETGSGKGFYEIKYRDPNNVIFDITDNGWLGSKK
jgi:predicted enzyme related to lactoylglutathione lyase